MSAPLRLLGVSFLNARPLVAPLVGDPPRDADGSPLFEVAEDLPSRCAQKLAAGECDVALVPVATLLDHPEWEVVPDVAIACRGAVLDLKDASLHYNDRKLELTKNEFRILQLLFERRGRTVPREDIMQALWESDSFIDDNTLTVNVARLRAHLAEIGLEGLIRTQKGLGYLVEDA